VKKKFGDVEKVYIFALSNKQKLKNMTTKIKIYNLFSDKFGNEYKFENFIDFASFWFDMSRKSALSLFPENFKSLQNAAANSKEARTKIIF
jgi:hypothetical protein